MKVSLMSDSILSDELWRRVEPLLPKPKKRRNVRHAGRKPADARRVMAGIVFALKTGVPWKNLPATSDFPSGHTCRRRLLEWHARGVCASCGRASSRNSKPRGGSRGSEQSLIALACEPATAARRPGKVPWIGGNWAASITCSSRRKASRFR
jgi:Putative transposase of IS4/5 family (DUF4096)